MNVGLGVWRQACKWVCVITDVKDKSTKHCNCEENGSTAQNVNLLHLLPAHFNGFLVEMKYKKAGCHQLP